MAKEYIWMSDTGNMWSGFIWLRMRKGVYFFKISNEPYTICWKCEDLSNYCLPLRDCPHVVTLVNTGLRLTSSYD